MAGFQLSEALSIMGAIAALFAFLNYLKLRAPALSITVGLSPIKNAQEVALDRDGGCAYIYYENKTQNFFKDFSIYCEIRRDKYMVDVSNLFPKNKYIEPFHNNEVLINIRRLLEDEKIFGLSFGNEYEQEPPEPLEQKESEDQWIRDFEEQMVRDPREQEQEQELQRQLKDERDNTVYITICYSYYFYGLKKKCNYFYKMNIVSATQWVQIPSSKHPCSISR